MRMDQISSNITRLISIASSTTIDDDDYLFLENILQNAEIRQLSRECLNALMIKYATSWVSSTSQPPLPPTVQQPTALPTILEIIRMSSLKCKTIIDKSNITSFNNKYITLNDENKVTLIHNLLKSQQRVIFNRLHMIVSSSFLSNTFMVEEPKIILIDAPPGCGKSFTISAFIASCNRRVHVGFTVYSKQLRENIDKLELVQAHTNCKFIMKTLNRRYYEAINLFKDKDTLYETLYYIYTLVEEHVPLSCQVLILDEYTIASPLFVLFLIWSSSKYKYNLILVGDKNQQKSISESAYNNRNNTYFLIETYISDVNMLSLEEQARITDPVHAEKVSNIKSYIRNKDEDLTFHLKYLIYQYFKPHFFKSQKFNNDVIYMAAYHKLLKRRLLKLETLSGNVIRAPFKYYIIGKDKETLTDIDLLDVDSTNNEKFLTYLLLIPGYIYNLHLPNGRMVRVKFINMFQDLLIVENVQTLEQYKVSITECSFHMNEEHRKWLLSLIMNSEDGKCHETDISIHNYPLTYTFVYTYHAVQGITIEKSNIDINLDARTLNSIYVALSRIKNESQIQSIETCDLFDLILTDYKNDKYYYKTASRNCNVNIKNALFNFVSTKSRSDDIDKLKFTEISSYKDFERANNTNKRICRSKYSGLYDNASNRTSKLREFIEVFRDDPKPWTMANIKYDDFVKMLESSGINDLKRTLDHGTKRKYIKDDLVDDEIF